MIAFALDTRRRYAVSAGAAVRGNVSTACGRGYWHGYFMTGVPAAMSD